MTERAYPWHCVWAEIAPEILPREFRYPYVMSVEFLRRLSRIRRATGVPFRFVSDYRPPEQNEEAGGVTGSAHTEDPGLAVDLRIHSSRERYRILEAAFAEGIRRIGVYPPTEHQRLAWGKNSGTLHLDGSTVKPQEVCWVNP